MILDEVECPACGDPRGMPLGILGSLARYRCRACGMTFSAPVPAPEPERASCPQCNRPRAAFSLGRECECGHRFDTAPDKVRAPHQGDKP